MSIGFAIFGLAACGSTDTATGRIGDPRGSNQDAATSGGGNQTGAGGSAGRIGSAGVIGSAGRDGSGGSSGRGGASGSGGNATSGAPGDSGVAGDAGGAKADAAPPPKAIPSTQTVTVTLTNDSGADRYIVTAGNNCTPFDVVEIIEGGLALVPIAIGFQCPCECPMPGAALPEAFRRVGAGESVDVTWDARELVTWRESITCNDGAPFPPRHSSSVTGVPQPVEAGKYRISLGVEPTLPSGCSGTDPDYRCNILYGTNDMSEYAPRCATSSVATVDFSLPETGDVHVTIQLN
jgi:hypothetical protein